MRLSVKYMFFICLNLTTPIVAQTRIEEISNAGIAQQSATFTIETDASQWVEDIGFCQVGRTCFKDSEFAAVGSTIAADVFSSDTITQIDVATGSGHSSSTGLWDVSQFESFNFSFKDHNAPGIFHYVLMYDTNGCYRQWLFNHPYFNDGHSLKDDQWYSITASLGNQQGTEYYTQDGSSSACADPEIFNRSSINYFEIGLFGDNVELNTQYRFEYSSSVKFNSGPLAAFNSRSSIEFDPVANPVPEPATWLTMLAGFFVAGTAIRVRRKKAATAIQL